MNRKVEETLAQVLKTTRARIRQDQRGTSYRVTRFLKALEKRPFESSLTIEEARKAAGIRDKSFSARFRDELGVRPYTYRQRLQVEAGEEMIDAGLPIPTAVLLAAAGLPSYTIARSTYRKFNRPLRIYHNPHIESRIDYYSYSLFRRRKLSERRAQALLWLLEDMELAEVDGEENFCPNGEAAVVELAIAEARRQIQRDRLLVPIGLDKILCHIADNLTSFQLSAGSAIAAAKSKDRSLGDQFKFYLGSTIKVYIDKARAGLMAHVLGETKMLVPEVGRAAGITTYHTTVSTFKRCTGECPMDIREPIMEPGLPVDTWLKAGLGDFDAVRETIAALRPLVPKSPKESVIAVDRFERWYVETEVWPTLEKLSLEEARQEVRRPAVSGMALVEFLREKAREEGRRNRQRGIDLAKLAQDALLGVTQLGGDALKEETAMGWALLGNQERLALDFPGAESSFEKAFECLEQRDLTGPSCVVGKIYYLNASFRIYERRFEEAVDLSESSLKNFRAIGDRAGEIEALKRRSIAYDYAAQPEKALADLMKILTLRPERDPLSFREHHSIAVVLERAGRYQAAVEALKSAKRIPVKNHLWQCHLSWTEASIDHGLRRLETAEIGYRNTIRGFTSLGQLFYSNFASLDLAILCLDRDRMAEAAEIAVVVVSFFLSLDLGQDALVALRVLDRSLRELELSRDVLVRLRNMMRRDPTLPARMLGAGKLA